MKKIIIILILVFLLNISVLAEDKNIIKINLEHYTDFRINKLVNVEDYNNYQKEIVNNYSFYLKNKGGFLNVQATLLPTEYFFIRYLKSLNKTEKIKEENIYNYKKEFKKDYPEYSNKVYISLIVIDPNVKKIEKDNLSFYYNDNLNINKKTKERKEIKKSYYTDTSLPGNFFKIAINVEDIKNIKKIYFTVQNKISIDLLFFEWHFSAESVPKSG